MMNNRTEIEDEVKGLVVNLRRYCHSKRCPSPHECPDKHAWRCRWKVSLSSSIAWSVADLLDMALSEERRVRIRLLLYRDLSSLITVVLRLNKRYPVLLSLLREAWFLLEKLEKEEDKLEE